ncbi:Oidioi.mRNA.OKI2018_I69.PAR.g11014.t1.cds [Oikopleura dioica]|uniref:Oidioi.mRNA.OKI2018_I69.PAR.g11014.t1.cds n=1 Tax=Oikopleura dioica TaxID=34765 RepID=A0ABN7RZU9_OIKDI|nr:Oidioi.mRNA.OKI2018_I69.PAR.g11014.t1.cds [Oikopleura dioica]
MAAAREQKEYEDINQFIEDSQCMNASVSRISAGNFLAWKVKIFSPLFSVHDLAENDSHVVSTIMIEFPVDYPIAPPVVYCTDAVNHPFLGEGNRIPFKQLKDKSAWSPLIPISLVITGIHDLFLSHLCTHPEENLVSRPPRITKKPNFDVKIPETAIDKYLDQPELPVNDKIREVFKLHEKQDELKEVQEKMSELKKAQKKLRKRRKKLEKAVKKRRRLAGVRRADEEEEEDSDN